MAFSVVLAHIYMEILSKMWINVEPRKLDAVLNVNKKGNTLLNPAVEIKLWSFCNRLFTFS